MTKIELYITIGLVVMLIVGLIGSKITQKKISRDPERQRKIEELSQIERDPRDRTLNAMWDLGLGSRPEKGHSREMGRNSNKVCSLVSSIITMLISCL